MLAIPPHIAPKVIYNSNLAKEPGFIPINRDCKTPFENIFAVGDVTTLAVTDVIAVPKAGIFAEGEGITVAKNIISKIELNEKSLLFDGKGGSNRRRKIFPEYKMGRKMSYRLNRAHVSLTRDEEKKMMIRQLNRVVEYLECLPISIMNMENCEADDVIGYLSKHIYKENKTTIVSTDKDFLQLVDETTRVYSPTKKKMYDEAKVFDEYGIHPKNFLLFRMFDGDKSDGIPGVNGIGKKTLIKLFPFMATENQHTLEDIYRSAETQKVPLCEKILQSKDLLDMNKTLMDLEDGIISGQQKLKVKEIVERPIQRLIKHRFQTMFLEDKMYQALPNLNSWLATTFNRMNYIAEETHNG